MKGFARAAAGIAALGLLAAGPLTVLANVPLMRVSSDSYHNGRSQHRTEVGPDTHSFGSTEVAAFQEGRFPSGGAAGIGFATTTDNGATWTRGALPGTTVFRHGPWAKISDPAVAYDPKHSVWLVSSLGLDVSASGQTVIVSRSTTGGTTWTHPVIVTNPGKGVEKDWIGCDQTATSPFYGNCYVQWDATNSANLVYMNTSTDGGLTWGAPTATADSLHGMGGQPVVQPNGTVVVPIANFDQSRIDSFVSTDGGSTWSARSVIAVAKDHTPGGSFRSNSMPSAVVDTSGTVYVTWESCTQETSCANNDILFSKSTDGVIWSHPAIVPIDPVGSGIDHMLPGIGVDGATSGVAAHLGLVFYTESASCTASCTVNAGFIDSIDGGSTWSLPLVLAGPISQAWLASSTKGAMVGDYNSTSFLNGRAFPVFASATAPVGTILNENMFTPKGGLAAVGGTAPLIAGSSSASGASGASTH